MKIVTLINTAAATTTAPAASDEGVTLVCDSMAAEGRDEILVQVVLTGTATVRVFGKIGNNVPWAQLGADITASGIYSFARVPKINAQVSTWTSGAVTVLAGI